MKRMVLFLILVEKKTIYHIIKYLEETCPKRDTSKLLILILLQA